MPSNILPASVSFFAKLLPSTYAMSAFKGLAYNQPADYNVGGSLAVLFAGGLISFLLALYLFKWDNNDASKYKKSILALLALLPYLVGAIFL